MTNRPFWVKQLDKAWEKRTLVWLSGVRRSGKTTLCKMIPDAVYLNCDLPSVGRQLENPEYYYRNLLPGSTVIFDEIHRIQDPSLVLKIGVDEFPDLKVLATGSSVLAATKKFRDSLTGRKVQLFLPPVLWNECIDDFTMPDLTRRLHQGGLPEFLLDDRKQEELFSEYCHAGDSRNRGNGRGEVGDRSAEKDSYVLAEYRL